jgi:nitroimidazol reductase NimA-like FMN-containing flavoprotein (pyridoxamine 5'-phosphate oxidase superfamily)
VVASVEELSLDECLDLLRSGSVGRIAVLDGDTPVALPVNYRLVEVPAMTWIAIRTRPGNVIDQAPMKVSFEIDGIDLVRERGWSVVARGTLHRVDVVGAGADESPVSAHPLSAATALLGRGCHARYGTR